METEVLQKTESTGTSAAPRRFKRLKLILFLAATGFICVAVFGLASRTATTEKFQKVADAAAQVNVQVVYPQKSPASVTLDLPGHTRAYYEAPIYAQTTGYLKMWYHDIGSRLKAGDILGEIDTPKVDQEFSQAQATLAMAKAQLVLAEANFHEAQQLLQKQVTSQRDLDTMQSAYLAQESVVIGDADAVRRLQALEDFKILRAPFDGFVINRSTDIGDLIVSGTGHTLFMMAQEDPLRVYVTVPENLAKEVRVGTKADLSFDEFPGRLFPATVVTTADAVSPSDRSLLTELQVLNPSYELWPGAYTMVHFHLESSTNRLLIRAMTLIDRKEGPQVAVVTTGGKVELRKIQLGRDLGTHLEIVGGLSATDRIIVNPPEGLSDGMEVHVVDPDQKLVSKPATGKTPSNN
jgi:RND family efflux transporter MFP subunit